MRKLQEIPVAGEDNFYSVLLHVYQLEGNEFWELDSMSHVEKCALIGVEDQADFDVMPGGVFHSYQFIVKPEYMIVEETLACNV